MLICALSALRGCPFLDKTCLVTSGECHPQSNSTESLKNAVLPLSISYQLNITLIKKTMTPEYSLVLSASGDFIIQMLAFYLSAITSKLKL